MFVLAPLHFDYEFIFPDLSLHEALV